jgi:hypothetical protein
MTDLHILDFDINGELIFHGPTVLVSQGLLIVEVSKSHSVGLFWKNDQPVAETSKWQQAALTTDRYPLRWRDSNQKS